MQWPRQNLWCLTMPNDIRRVAGVPTAANFANNDGTPIVIDTTTGLGYTLKAGDIVTPIGSGSGGGGGLSDGDKGDIVVSGGGTVLSIDSAYNTATIASHTGQADPHTQYLQKTSLDSGVATITVPAPGRLEWSETAAVAGVSAGQKVLVSLGAHLDSDENSAELLDVAGLEAVAGTDSITFTASFDSMTSGAINLHYMAL